MRRRSKRSPMIRCSRVIRASGSNWSAEHDVEFARELRDVAFQSLTRSQAQLLIVGRLTALEKVAPSCSPLTGARPMQAGRCVAGLAI